SGLIPVLIPGALSAFQAISYLNYDSNFESTAFTLLVSVSCLTELLNVALVIYAYRETSAHRTLLHILTARLVLETPLYLYEGLYIIEHSFIIFESVISLISDYTFLALAAIIFFFVRRAENEGDVHSEPFSNENHAMLDV
ncbi:hypothetical protein PENTCL1PPCAC_14481, partial [Pristionchus entomophagus]